MSNEPEMPDDLDETIQTDGVTRKLTGQPTVESGGIRGKSGLAAKTDRYDVGNEIARGGMGAVLEANDSTLGRTVAMKVLLTQGASVSSRLRFIREAVVLGRLEHPNIVPIHEFNSDDEGRLFYTMKKVEGETLQAIIHALRKGDAAKVLEWPLDRLLSVFLRICDAIAFAHSRCVIHRDLKPENVMIGAFGEVLVMDWGLAKLPDDNLSSSDLSGGTREGQPQITHQSADNLTLDGTVMGSPQFMSPEQAMGRVDEVDEKSDIFSLGGILYAILTLRPPVPGETISEVMHNARSGEIVPPTEVTGKSRSNTGQSKPNRVLLPHCPGGRAPKVLSAVTMRAMSLDAASRYQGVEELAADVAAHRRGYATSVEHLGVWGLLWLWMRRNKELNATAFFLLAVITWLWIDFTVDLRDEKQTAKLEAREADRARSEAESARNTAEMAGKAALKALTTAKITIADQARERNDWETALRELNLVPEDHRDARWHRVRHGADNSIQPPIAPSRRMQTVVAHPTKPGVFIYGIQIPQHADRSEIGLVDVTTGERSVLLRRPRTIATAISPAGRFLALLPQSIDDPLEIVDLDSGTTLFNWPRPKGFKSMQFDQTGEVLFYADSSSMTALNWKLGKTVWARMKVNGPKSLNSQGHPLLVAAGKLRLIDPVSGQTVGTFPVPEGARHMDLDPTGSNLVFRTADRLQGMNLHTGEETFSVSCGTHPHFRIRFMPDGRHFLSGTRMQSGQPGFTVKIRESRTGRVVEVLSGGRSNADQISVHPLTGHILTDSGNRLWHPRLEPPESKFPALPSPSINVHGEANTWGFVDEHNLIFTSPIDGTLTGLDIRSGAVDHEFVPGHERKRVLHAVFDMTSDRQHLVTARAIRFAGKYAVTLAKWDGQAFREQKSWTTGKVAHKHDIMRLSPDGRLLLRSAFDQSHILDSHTGETLVNLRRNKSGPVFRLQDARWMDEGNRLLALVVTGEAIGRGKLKNRIMLWNGNTGDLLTSTENSTSMHSLAVAPDGRRFAESGTESVIRFRDMDSLVTKMEIHGHDEEITALAWHPSKNLLASVSRDRSLIFWDAETGAQLGSIHGCAADPVGLRFSPSGDQIAVITEGPENQVRVWRTPEFSN